MIAVHPSPEVISFWLFAIYIMMLCHYLTPKDIIRPLSGRTKGELLKALVDKLAERHRLKNPAWLFQTIMDREEEGATFLPTGVAIPHARVPDVNDIILMLGVVPGGFCETPESDPTYLIFLFLSPTKEAQFGRHLKLLSRISAIFHDPSFVKEVASIPTTDEIFSLIQQRERETLEE